jgi:hypothetical protein
MMVAAVRIWFAFVLLAMLAVTVAATLDRGITGAWNELWPELWFRATLADAYFGFLAFWGWIAWRERSWGIRLAWLMAILALGNFAMAAYALVALGRLRPGEGIDGLFRRRTA